MSKVAIETTPEELGDALGHLADAEVVKAHVQVWFKDETRGEYLQQFHYGSGDELSFDVKAEKKAEAKKASAKK